MANLSSSSLSSLSTILAAMTPQMLKGLGNHLSANAQIQAANDLEEATPANVATQKAAIASIAGVPPAVITWLDNAVKAAAKTPPDQAGFDNAISQAQVALTAGATNTGILGGIFSGL